MGPTSPSPTCPAAPRIQVDFVTGLIDHLAEHGYAQVEPDEAAEEAWTAHVLEAADPFLVADTAWFRGANIPGKADRILLYFGGLVIYREKAAEVATNGYEGFTMRRASQPTTAG